MLLGLLLTPPLQATTVSQDPALSDRQTLVKGNGAEPESLDPAQIRSGFPGEVVLVDLFEGLVSEDGQGRIVPAQAQRWETSADGLVWRFFLRPQLKWSNGEPLTAADFVYAWRRLLDPAQASPLPACCWQPASTMPSPSTPARSISTLWGWKPRASRS